MNKYVKVDANNDLLIELENENFETIRSCIILDAKFSEGNDAIIVKLSNKFFNSYYDEDVVYVPSRNDDYMAVARNNKENQEKMKDILLRQIYDYIDYYKENSIKDELKSANWIYKYPLCILTAAATVIYANLLLIPIGIITISVIKKLFVISIKNKLEKDFEKITTPFSNFYELCVYQGQNLDSDSDKEFYIELDEKDKEYVNTNVYVDENNNVKQKAKTLVKRKKKLTK